MSSPKIHAKIELPTGRRYPEQYKVVALCGRSGPGLRYDDWGTVFDEDYMGVPTCRNCLKALQKLEQYPNPRGVGE